MGVYNVANAGLGLGVYSLRVYGLGAYSLGLPFLDFARQSPGTGSLQSRRLALSGRYIRTWESTV